VQVNHFPASWTIGRKDKLCKNLARMKREFGEPYNISAVTFILPGDRAKLMREMEEDPKVRPPPSKSIKRQ
jgi:tubulin polyglutamylase TTLL4